MIEDLPLYLLCFTAILQRNAVLSTTVATTQTPTSTNPTTITTEPVSTSKLHKLNETEFNKYKDKYCPLVPKITPDELKIPGWKDELTFDEVIELTLVNMGYGLSTDSIGQLPNDLGYKRRILELIHYIARRTCQSAAISPNFLNAAKNLFLYYLIKKEGKPPVARSNSTNGTDGNSTTTAPTPPPTTTGPPTEKPRPSYNETIDIDWNQIIQAITACASEVSPMIFSEECGVLKSYVANDGSEAPMEIVLEDADTWLGESPDVIIDSVWWMFSATFARCYGFFYPEEDIILVFLQRFRDDILSPFFARWMGASDLFKHFSIIFGPLSVFQEHRNLRACATSAYNFERMAGRHLVRPLEAIVDGTQVSNKKASMS